MDVANVLACCKQFMRANVGVLTSARLGYRSPASRLRISDVGTPIRDLALPLRRRLWVLYVVS